MNRLKLVGPWAAMMALLIGTLTVVCLQRAIADQAVANAVFVSYDLTAGSSSAAITVPANQSVLVMGCCTTYGWRGVGQVVMECEPDEFLQWVGLNSNSDTSTHGTTTDGFSGTVRTKIVSIDYVGQVHLEVFNGNSFVVKNDASTARNGNVTLIY